MQLRDEGRLSLDDPLSRHVPEAHHGSPTIGRMLAHVSGLQREFPDDMWESMIDPPREQLLEGIVDAEQVLGHGEHWHYSNLAYALLGEVVARLRGDAADRVISERLLGPVGLERTTWLPEGRHAQGYFVEPYRDGLVREAHVELQRSAPIGQLWSTTADLARWGSFLAHPDPAILSAPSAELMHTVQTIAEPVRWSIGWGLGLQLLRKGERVYAGHGGAMPGFFAFMLWSRVDDVGAAVLTNSSHWGNLEATALRLAETTLERWPADPAEWLPEEAPPPELAGVLGRWWTEGTEFVVSFRGGRLEARLVEAPDWRPPSVWEPEGPDRFRVASGRERGELVRVVRDEGGEAARLYWATYPCTRRPEVFGV
jgi:CubicO group peptidase (beta-lactamase class C family)